MVIRSAVPRDADAIAARSSQLGYPVSPDEVTAHQASLRSLPDHSVLVAEAEQGLVVGWVHVFVSRRLFVPPFAKLGGIVVLDSHRRCGVGSSLLSRAEEWALGVGCSVLRIRSNIRRVDADRFYRGCGYRLSKTQSVFEKALVPNQPA